MQSLCRRGAFTYALIVLLISAGCGGGGSGGGGGGAGGIGAPVPAASAQSAADSAALPAAVPAVSGGMLVTGFGGLEGATTLTHADGDTFDYAETPTITFNRVVNMTTVGNSLSITPSAPFSLYDDDYGKRLQITLRKTPGVVYAIALKAGLQSSDGSTLASTAVYHLTTPAAVTIPARVRAVSGEPYRYGVLVHPDPSSLSGANAAQIANIAGSMHAGFVRIDYTGAEVMPANGKVNFTLADQIVALLTAQKITLMPILEQYNTAAWQADGQKYPAIFATPQLYAQFVSTVVTHLRTTAPQITRVELFNEPNLTGWWTSPNPTYAATDGSATAQYMRAGYAAAKSSNPALTVVGPALADGGSEIDPRTFLTNMYAAGCRTGTCWDVLSVHPYAWVDPAYTMPAAASNRWQIYQDLQAIAVAHGDLKPHVMLTEFGFSTATQNGFDPQVQARYLARGFNLMLADPTIDGIVWTNVYAPGTDFYSRTSVTDAAFNPLPAEAAFRAFAAP